MKSSFTPRSIEKKVVSALMAFALVCCQPAHSSEPRKDADESSTRIMLALLLDTSNSMDGLIDQAKSQLWRIVNELAASRCADGRKPSIRIALYEYGNDGLPSSEGYIRLVSPLTDDLDLISERLFGLRTNGGNEFCGQVISTSLKQLDWTTAPSDLKMIFIAGNEPFTQGNVPYAAACALAREKDVIVNTIFCGDFNEGISTKWKDGADAGRGTYMSIQQNQKTIYIPTPFDARIDALNENLNDTYIYYGKTGESKKRMQVDQDKNAEQYGQANKVERAVSKSSHAYVNKSWDLVDAAKEDEKVVAKLREEELPAEMQAMSVEKREAYVKEKAAQRASIQTEIQALNAKRQEYIRQNTPAADSATMLDAAMINAVKAQARAKNLTF